MTHRLDLKPGDKLVVELYGPSMSEATLKRIKETWEGLFPGHKVLILLNGVKLSILRESEPAGTVIEKQDLL